jgi:hypothetical protein
MNEFVPDNKHGAPGTIENPIIDSRLTLEKALRPNPAFSFSPEIFERQMLLPVVYISFDGKYHEGQIVIDKELERDVKDFFEFLLLQNFPLNTVIPIADHKYDFDDGSSMTDNNSSGFNPRYIAGTTRESNHAFGRAIDLNPFLNPFIKDGNIEPKGAIRNEEAPGTFVAGSPIVEFLKQRGWIWGGEYQSLKDYHHFEKPLSKEEK